MNEEVLRLGLPHGGTLTLVRGDITSETTDAIVNAANAHLAHGAGVAGAIVRKGGPAIQQESDAWVSMHGPVPHRRPAITGSGDLPCGAVIHAVGPVWGEGDEDGRLAAAVRGSLELATTKGFASLSLPAISTGIFGFPLPRAAAVMSDAIHRWASENEGAGLRDIRIVLFDETAVEAFRAMLAEDSPGRA